MDWAKVFQDQRRWLLLSGHIVLLAFAYYASFLLRFDFVISRHYLFVFAYSLPVVLLIKLLVLSAGGLLRGWWRYAGITDLKEIILAGACCSGFTLVVVLLFYRNLGYPRSVVIIDFLLTVSILGGMRFLVRLYQETSGRHVPRKNTLIVGAGQAGSTLVRELKESPELDLNPIGYVDDDPTKKGIRIQGIPVLGRVADAPLFVEKHRVTCIVIAMPSVNGGKIKAIIEQCSRCRVDLKLLPALGDRINGESTSRKVRSVQVEDLLGRPPVSLDMDALRHKLQDKVLMITGAGGSIGSELARQLAEFRPRKLVLFERAENQLHAIDIELRARFSNLTYVPAIGDILDVRALREVVGQHRPDSIFHAAAYKHVPMMEKNCFQAIVNNVFGTYNVALVARQYGVPDFLMISSDKAVNPTNVMGVTKRVAELVILALQEQQTRFVSVRFGNVLGSAGSVLPLFEQQLARGGPLTVTHPEARRYFMTIPEAVQLVLQASTMGKGGEIFVLDMGSPVLIADLAKNLIRLSGLDPDTDVAIAYTGLRPG